MVVGLYVYKRISGKDILKIIASSRPVIVALTAVVDAVYKIAPSDTIQIIKAIMNAAVDATEFAEKAWLAGELEREERNAKAKELARDVLQKAGIEVTPQIEAIVSGVIEMTCMLLPHGVKPDVTN